LSHKEDGRIKLFLTWHALNCRLQHPGLFTSGAYLPVEPSGPQADHVFSFIRRDQPTQALIAVPRLLSRLGPKVEAGSWDATVWEDTFLPILDGAAGRRWVNIFSDEIVTEREHAKGTALPLTDVFASFPVGLLLAVPQ
jgi:(1->4)-alpha-D-glucan 1-alpha-D-glucosylmutase